MADGAISLRDLPAEENKLRTEGRAHGREDAVGSWFAWRVDEDVFKDGEDRGCGEIADFAEAAPGGFEGVLWKVESGLHGFKDFGTAGVEDVARDVIKG